MSKKLKAAVNHHEREVAELRADRELAVEYLKAAMESLDNPDDRAAGLLALRTVAEAYGGLGAVAGPSHSACRRQRRHRGAGVGRCEPHHADAAIEQAADI